MFRLIFRTCGTYCLIVVLLFYGPKSEGLIRLGFIESDPTLINLCQSALLDASLAGNCVNDKIEIVSADGCNLSRLALGTVGAAALVAGAPITRNSIKVSSRNGDTYGIQGLVSSRCATEAAEIAHFAYFWKLAVINRIESGNPELFTKQHYPTIIKIPEMSIVAMGMALEKFMNSMGQSQVIFVGPIRLNREIPTLISEINEYFAYVNKGKNFVMNNNATTKSRIIVEKNLKVDPKIWDTVLQAAIQLRSDIKMIVIDGELNDVAVLKALGILELSREFYLILILCGKQAILCLKPIQSFLTLANNILILSPYIEDYNTANERFIAKYSSEVYHKENFLTFYSTYNACYGFCYGTRMSTNFKDGKKFAQNFYGKSFKGNYGTVNIDSGGARLEDFVFQLVLLSGELRVVYMARSKRLSTLDCKLKLCFDMKLEAIDKNVWKVERDHELSPCFYNGGCTNSLPYIVIVVVVTILLTIATIIYIIRRKRRLDVYRMHWKISKQQIKVIENKQAKGKAVGVGPETAWFKRRVLHAYALIGTTKSEFIMLKQLKKIFWKKLELKFIFELKRLNHDNLTNFLGIYYNESDKFYLCHNLVERGTLEDYINDLDFQLDNTFRSAFFRDILKGIQYLHKSSVGFHGMLSLQNVLIDPNWVLKLTNFGIVNLLNKAIVREQLKIQVVIPLQTYLTVAPENFSTFTAGFMYPKGTANGDIYSFGMILYHILFRTAPFNQTALNISEVLEEVKTNNLIPFIENTTPEERPLVEAMEQCWERTPDLRPKLRQLSQVFSTVFQSSQGNLIDQMRRMNDKHALNLENLVAQRSAELEIAREETERLLQEMLPPTIALKLKAQQEIEPRSYDSATVLFCQLVDFAVVLNKFPPHQVIDFLNSVFTTFDIIICNHDAYKVETTGETYMVASGVPNENENRHVFEISEVALEFRDASHIYKVENFPEWKLQLRIGYHCGAIAAGVIGAKAPRYCLFGDTVNFASRMQSNCPPNQIQMSEPTALMLMAVDRYKLTKRGIVKVKGKGDVNTYWLNEHSNNFHGSEPDVSHHSRSLL